MPHGGNMLGHSRSFLETTRLVGKETLTVYLSPARLFSRGVSRATRTCGYENELIFIKTHVIYYSLYQP